METEATLSKRPRPWLLVALAVAVVAAAAMQFWPTNPAPAGLAPSNPRGAPAERGGAPIDPADLDVRLGDLKAPPAEAEGADRNPFRFQPKPPPPPPPEAARPKPQPIAPENAEPPGPPPPPPIPLKFIGTVEPKPGDKVAAFSDCRYTFKGREGDIIDGRYRLVRIGVESVVMEYVDGRGRMTIRLSGQECVGR